jgi:DNA-binding NarL/FixJ family response regulator
VLAVRGFDDMMITQVAYAPGQVRHGAVSAALTVRELEVLRLLADGLSTKQIAARLNVSFKTAACHRYRILQKLCVDSTVSAVRWAIRSGLVEP